MKEKTRIWIDVKNSHEPLLFKSLMKDLPYEFYITARDYAEVVPLLKKYGIEHKIVGKYHAKNKVSKALYLGWRSIRLAFTVPHYDFLLSHGSIYGILASRIRRRPSITITDNDFYNKTNRMIYEKSNHLVIPKFLDYEKYRVHELHLFDGFKEDIYIANFEPDKCENELPFEQGKYVLIRPEAYKAYYLSMKKSIVEKLIQQFTKENMSVVLLPRYPEEREKFKKYENVYIPPKPVNGLCASWNSLATLTGSGTLGREAACMSVPAISFFPGEKLLSVDAELIKRGWLYHSRDPQEIVEYVLSAKRNNRSLERSKKVKREVIKIIREIVEE